MPLSGPNSWLQTLDEFLAHWDPVNTELGSALIVNGYARADLVIDRAALAAAITALVQAENFTEGFRVTRDELKTSLKERLRQLSLTIRAGQANSIAIGRLPEVPHFNDNSGKWGQVLDDYAHIWLEANAALASDIILFGGYTQAMFAADVADLKAAFTSWVEAERDEIIARETRDTLFAPIPSQLAAYRLAVQGAFPLGHEMIASLPNLYPAPGHTPVPVMILSATFDELTLEFVIVYSASADSDLQEYELRGVLGSEWEGPGDVIGNNPPGVHEFRTSFGATNGPGFAATFKIYTILNTANESGSDPVTIVVPPGGGGGGGP